MKPIYNYLFVFVLAFYINAAHATVVIDSRTVLAPELNFCTHSFGNQIQTPEIINLPGAEMRIKQSKNLLIRWIQEGTYPGFYLRELDAENFYWQFVETRKHIGAILMVTSDTIRPEFYTTLGAGLQIPGAKYYGLATGENRNGDIFSMVMDKESFSITHFENWRFTENQEPGKWKENVRLTLLGSQREQDAYKKAFAGQGRASGKPGIGTRLEALRVNHSSFPQALLKRNAGCSRIS